MILQANRNHFGTKVKEQQQSISLPGITENSVFPLFWKEKGSSEHTKGISETSEQMIILKNQF